MKKNAGKLRKYVLNVGQVKEAEVERFLPETSFGRAVTDDGTRYTLLRSGSCRATIEPERVEFAKGTQPRTPKKGDRVLVVEHRHNGGVAGLWSLKTAPKGPKIGK